MPNASPFGLGHERVFNSRYLWRAGDRGCRPDVMWYGRAVFPSLLNRT